MKFADLLDQTIIKFDEVKVGNHINIQTVKGYSMAVGEVLQVSPTWIKTQKGWFKRDNVMSITRFNAFN